MSVCSPPTTNVLPIPWTARCSLMDCKRVVFSEMDSENHKSYEDPTCSRSSSPSEIWLSTEAARHARSCSTPAGASLTVIPAGIAVNRQKFLFCFKWAVLMLLILRTPGKSYSSRTITACGPPQCAAPLLHCTEDTHIALMVVYATILHMMWSHLELRVLSWRSLLATCG